MKRVKILICEILLITSFSLIFTSCSDNSDSSSTASNSSIEIKERQYIQGMDVFLLIDQSGSMIGEKGTDPTGIRYDASKYLIQSLFVKKFDNEFPNRISITHFGDNATSSGLLEVLPGNLSRIQEAINSGKASSEANTNVFAALQAVKNDFDKAPKYLNRRERAIVIFTDGKPEKGNNESQSQIQSYFKEIKDYVQNELKEFKIFIIGIDNPAANVKFSQTISDWKGFLNLENINSLGNLDELYTKFNESVEKILELNTNQVLVKDSGEFSVNPYVEELEFHVFTRRPLQLFIYNPQKKLIKIDTSLTNNSGYIIHKEKSPEPGTWTYTLKRQKGDTEPIRIVRNEIPFRLELLTPEPLFNSLGQRYFPLGKKVRLKAQFTRENQEEIIELNQYPLSFSARITSQDNVSFDKQIRFVKENKGGPNYYADDEFSFDKEGKYKVRLTVKGGTAVEFIQTETLEIVKIPYFEFEEPRPLIHHPLGTPLYIKVAVKLGNDKVDPSKYFLDNPSNLALTQITNSPEGERSAAIWLNQNVDDKSILEGVLPVNNESFNFNKTGIYELSMDVKVRTLVEYKLYPGRILSRIDIYSDKDIWGIIEDTLLYLFSFYLLIIIVRIFKYFVGHKYEASMNESVTANFMGSNESIILWDNAEEKNHSDVIKLSGEIVDPDNPENKIQLSTKLFSVCRKKGKIITVYNCGLIHYFLFLVPGKAKLHPDSECEIKHKKKYIIVVERKGGPVDIYNNGITNSGETAGFNAPKLKI